MNTPIAWDPNQLWNKSLKFAERAARAERGDPESILFSCLALELLGRAVLTAVHPALNADPQSEGAHIMYACGVRNQSGPGKSIPAHAVFRRLEVIYPDFKAHRAVCEYLMNLRNEELHTGSEPFGDLPESKWLSDYYAAAHFLCTNLSKTLRELLGDDEASHAEQLIAAREDARRADVMRRVATCAESFNARTEDERRSLAESALAATRFHQWSECPACGNQAQIDGNEVRRSEASYSDGELLVSITCATNELRCIACGLQLRTLAECAVANVEPRFTRYESMTLHDLHQDQEYLEYDNM